MKRRKQVLRVLDLVDKNDSRIEVQIEQDQPNTFVKLMAWSAIKKYAGIGWSKVCRPDEWNSDRGVEIAMARAANSLVDSVEQNKGGHHDKDDPH